MEFQSLKKNSRLGRGLDSLLGPPIELKALSLDIEKIHPNQHQPRRHFEAKDLEGLQESIKNHGVLQPILVQAKGEHYEIIAGERRWRAALKAGLHKIPAIVKNPTKQEAPLWALLENLQRKDLNPLEEAKAYKMILESQGIKQSDLAKTLGISRSALTNSLRLLKLDKQVQNHLEQGQISLSQAKELLSLKSLEQQRQLASKCIQKKLTVRSLVKIQKTKTQPLPYWVTQSLSRLEQIFFRKVQIKMPSNQKQGRLSFVFHSEEELKDLLKKLGETKK